MGRGIEVTLPTTLDGVAELARRHKLEQVRRHRPGDREETYDLRTNVVVVRDGTTQAVVWAGAGPDAARHVVYWSALFMGADELYLVADSVMRHVGPDEADYDHQGAVMDRWHRGDRAGITEALVVHRYPAAGAASWRFYPYTRQGRTVRWTDVLPDEADEVDGAIPDYAREGYRRAQEVSSVIAQIRRSVAGADPASFARALARFVSLKEGVGAVELLTPAPAMFVEGAEQ
jgi:hypothetical protein